MEIALESLLLKLRLRRHTLHDRVQVDLKGELCLRFLRLLRLKSLDLFSGGAKNDARAAQRFSHLLIHLLLTVVLNHLILQLSVQLLLLTSPPVFLKLRGSLVLLDLRSELAQHPLVVLLA